MTYCCTFLRRELRPLLILKFPQQASCSRLSVGVASSPAYFCRWVLYPALRLTCATPPQGLYFVLRRLLPRGYLPVFPKTYQPSPPAPDDPPAVTPA